MLSETKLNMTSSAFRCLNLGCGTTYIESWTNIDFNSKNKHVIKHDLSKKLPFPDNSFEVVYHSHLLEHFSKVEGEKLINECYRILTHNGILRIAVPDLEKIAKEYITNLQSVNDNCNPLNKANYEWSVVELLDQMTRRYPGGEMLKYWKDPEIINSEYLQERVGNEFLQYKISQNKNIGFISRIRSFFSRLKKFFYRKNKLVAFLGSGEVHQWMYDRYSLRKLLESADFKEIQITDAFNSRIPNWEKYISLDVENNKTRKPDSLFMEAEK